MTAHDGPGIWVDHIVLQDPNDANVQIDYGVLEVEVEGAFIRTDGARRPFRLRTCVPAGDALAADLHGDEFALLDLFRAYTLGQRIRHGYTEFCEHEVMPFRLDEIIAQVEARDKELAPDGRVPEPGRSRRRPSIVDVAMYGAGMVRDNRGAWVPRKPRL